MKNKSYFYAVILPFFLLVFLFLPSHSFPEESILDINPLYYQKTDESGTLSDLKILGPLFELKYTPEKKSYALRPVLNIEETTDKKEITADFFWPLGKYSKDAKTTQKRFIPFFFSKYETHENGKNIGDTLFLPFYIGGIANSGKYQLFFPFYGNLKEWFGKDELRFVAFPLYSDSRKGDDFTWNLFWPLLRYSKGNGHTGYRIFPFYSYDKKEGRYLKEFYLWPLLTSHKFYKGDKVIKELLLIPPVYGYEKSGRRNLSTILFPVYIYEKNNHLNYTRYDILWPIISLINGETRKVRHFFPLYRSDKRENSTHNFYLWPLFWYDRISTDNYEKKVKRFFPLFADRQENFSDEKKTKRTINFWPLVLYKKGKENEKEISALSLNPFSGDGLFIEKFEKNFSPFWTLYKYENDNLGNSQTTILWNLCTAKKGKDKESINIPLLFSYKKEGNTKNFSILKGFLERKESEEKSRWKIFYIPLF